MMDAIAATLKDLFGTGKTPEDLTVLEMTLRAVVVFITALVMVRFGDKRFLARRTAFDIILAFILASTLSRAINGPAPLFETLAVCFVLVLLHRALAALAFHSRKFGELIKGRVDTLIDNGRLNEAAMRKNHVSHGDIEEDVRLSGGPVDFHQIECARIERNGCISVIRKSEPASAEPEQRIKVMRQAGDG